MEDSSLLLVGIFCIFGFLLGVFITRWIFNISTITQNLKSQTVNIKIMARLMEQMAIKQGYTKEEIEQLTKRCVSEVRDL